VRLDFDVRSSNPPSITLRATGFGLPKTAACNNGAGGSTEKNVKPSTYLTEPQGIIKNLISVATSPETCS
jgi:hypothetical protein